MFFTLPILAVSLSVMAEDGIKSSIEAGLVLTSGNTKTKSVNIKGKLDHAKGKSRNTLSVETLYVDGDQGKLSEKYLGAGKSAYQFGKKSYGFINLTLERDLFSGYDYQSTATAGIGYRFIDTKKITLDFETGPGYRRDKLDTEEAKGKAIARVSGLFAYRISKTSTFTEEVTYEGLDAGIFKSVTALTAQIAGNMAMKTSLTIKNNSDAPENVKATDSETALTLVYTF